MTGTLVDLMNALDALGSAVSRDDRAAYLVALQTAAAAEASPEQIKDAHAWRGLQRMWAGLTPTSFDWEGRPHRWTPRPEPAPAH